MEIVPDAVMIRSEDRRLHANILYQVIVSFKIQVHEANLGVTC